MIRPHLLRSSIVVALSLALVDTLRAQCPDGQQPIGQELAINGDFSAGDQYFNSGYTSCPGPCNTEATYTVLSDPTIANPGFYGSDHTDGSGEFMAVNGDPTPGTPVWCQTIVVQPNMTYVFSAWIASLSLQNPAQLLFSINGIDLATAINAPAVTGQWDPFNATWDSGANTTATICIVNNNTAVAGNDFGLDDISFRACCASIPDPSQVITACNREPITLEAPDGYTYLWNTGDTTRMLQVVPEENGRWTLALFSSCTAISAAYGIVLLDTAVADVFVPNTFTPNGDGINDGFRALATEVKDFRLYVFNRWGERIYEADALDKPWDGTYKGVESPIDTYVWRVDLTELSGHKRTVFGHVNLLR